MLVGRLHSRQREPLDPDYGNATLIANWDEPDGTTSYTEKSSNAAVATFRNGCDITSDVTFSDGTNTLDCTGAANKYVTFPDADSWDNNEDRWTLEFYFYRTGGSYTYMVNQWDPSTTTRAWSTNVTTSNFTNIIQAQSAGTTNSTPPPSASPGFTIADNTWNHFVWQIDESDLHHFAVNGVWQVNNKNTGIPDIRNPAGVLLSIGGCHLAGSGAFDGYMGPVRIYKGINKYDDTSSFTPDFTKFPEAG